MNKPMNKPNLPEELFFGKSYSFQANLKVNGWAFIAMLISFAGDALLHRYQDWHVALRSIIVLAPLLPALLWARSVSRWIRGMDELHRRVALEACLFATVCTLFIVTAWHVMETAGVFQTAIFQAPRVHLSSHFSTCSFPITLVMGFYFLGHTIFNRRYE
jgi:hypothetical protein